MINFELNYSFKRDGLKYQILLDLLGMTLSVLRDYQQEDQSQLTHFGCDLFILMSVDLCEMPLGFNVFFYQVYRIRPCTYFFSSAFNLISEFFLPFLTQSHFKNRITLTTYRFGDNIAPTRDTTFSFKWKYVYLQTGLMFD